MKKFMAKYASGALFFIAFAFIFSFKGLIGSAETPNELMK